MSGMAAPLRQRRPPGADLPALDRPDPPVPERLQRCTEVVDEPRLRRGRRVVLLDERLHELTQRDVGSMQRAEAHATQFVFQRLARLALGAEPGRLPAGAVGVAEADRPQPALLAEDLPALRAHAAASSPSAI